MWSAPALRIWMVLRLRQRDDFSQYFGIYSRRERRRTRPRPRSAAAPRRPSTRRPRCRRAGRRTPRGNRAAIPGSTSPPMKCLCRLVRLARLASGQAELGPAVRRDEVRVVRVLLDPGVDVGAERENGQPALPGVVEAEPGQVGRQAPALEGRLDLGVDQADLLAAALVGEEAGQLARDPQLVAGLFRVSVRRDAVTTAGVTDDSAPDGSTVDTLRLANCVPASRRPAPPRGTRGAALG